MQGGRNKIKSTHAPIALWTREQVASRNLSKEPHLNDTEEEPMVNKYPQFQVKFDLGPIGVLFLTP